MKFIAKSMLILLIIALCLGATAYGVLSSNVKQSGTITLAHQDVGSETRTISNDVELVEMNGPFDLEVVQGEKAGLVVEGEERLIPKVVVQQEGKLVRIGTTGMLVTMNQTVKVTLTLPKLTSIVQSGSGDCEVRGFNGPEIAFMVNGSGDLSFVGKYQHVVAQTKGSGNIELDVGTVDRADLSVAGSGDIEAKGKLNKLNVLLTGSGSIDAERLIAQQTEVVSKGAGSIKTYASKSARVIASSSGDVEIYGNPEQKTITRTGSGDVTLN